MGHPPARYGAVNSARCRRWSCTKCGVLIGAHAGLGVRGRARAPSPGGLRLPLPGGHLGSHAPAGMMPAALARLPAPADGWQRSPCRNPPGRTCVPCVLPPWRSRTPEQPARAPRHKPEATLWGAGALKACPEPVSLSGTTHFVNGWLPPRVAGAMLPGRAWRRLAVQRCPTGL